ncbi:MAG: hypothetical protein P4L43_16350 [Syntrophobacteraceae bacterium]|nr:hypothetical protein [Syntrophobacteraceae bacterium]
MRKEGWQPSTQILRSVDRPEYFMLPGKEIRKKLSLSGKPHIPGEKRGPLKHPVERRGHYRYYKSLKYSEELRDVAAIFMT